MFHLSRTKTCFVQPSFPFACACTFYFFHLFLSTVVPPKKLVFSCKVRTGRVSVREEDDDEHLLEGPRSRANSTTKENSKDL